MSMQQKKGKILLCIHCQGEMTPHQGKKRKHKWHFQHKNKFHECGYESYLHKLAKIKIKEVFQNSQEFYISYNVTTICSGTNCPLTKADERCKCETVELYNLKDHYDTCEEEKAYKSFRADLMLSSSNYPDREPILIEICVTHECSEEKIQNGVRIIEVNIGSEEDIDNIVSSKKLERVRKPERPFLFDNKKILFYNFKSELIIDPNIFTENINTIKHIHYLYVDEYGYCVKGKCNCNQNPYEFLHDNTFFIICYFDFNWVWALLELKKESRGLYKEL